MAKKSYIFQEKLSKEMLEYNGYREGPLIESEGYFGIQKTKSLVIQILKKILFMQNINSGWGKSAENTILSLEAIEKYNNAIFTTPNRTVDLSYVILIQQYL